MTLRQYLDNKKWAFKEARMIPIWNDLDRIADATGQDLSAAAVSTLDLSAISVQTTLGTHDAGQLSSISSGVAIQKAPKDAQFH